MLLSLAVLVCMVLVHLFSTRYALADARYRCIWLSVSGGVSIGRFFALPDAYVALFFAVLAGGVIPYGLKETLPIGSSRY